MKSKRKFFTDERVVLIIRWWVAGAIYFFIGWGTGLGNNSNIIDLVFFLGLTIGLVNSFALNPILNKMFNLKPTKKYMEITVIDKAKSRLGEIFKGMLIVLMMVYSYAFINTSLINLFKLPADSVPLPGEPISFGILYIILFILLEKVKGFFIKDRKE